MSIAEKLMTAEEFAAFDDGRKTELVRGRVVEMTRPKPLHGRIVFAIARILGSFIVGRDLGRWFGESGVITERDPDSVRGPDAAFASYDRIPRDADDEEYCQAAPELVFEVLSPSDRSGEISAKTVEYLRCGVNVVCLVYPESQTVDLHMADGRTKTLAVSDIFELPEILPGFRCQVADFFPHSRQK